jgi:HEAT repeat protein
VKLPNGSLLGSDAAIAKIKKGDKGLIDAAWSYVKAGPSGARLAAIKAAPLLELKDLDARLLPILKSDEAGLRSAALDGLKGRDNKTVNTALRQVMDKDADASLRDKAAGLLSASKDPAFSTAAQYHALRSKDPKVVAAAATGLGDSKQKEATDQLVKTLGNADKGVRTAVIAALLKRGDTKAMIKALDDSKLSLDARIETARALTGAKDKGAVHSGLLFLAVNGKGDDSAGAAAKLATFDKAATYTALAKALKHSEAETRRAAASALARLGSPKGLGSLAAADTKNADSGEAMLLAIRNIYAKQPLDFVLKGTKNKDETLRRQAVATLGKMVKTQKSKSARKTIVKTLEPLSEAKDPLIRAAAARSYGSMAGDDVRPRILKLASDSAIEVQRASAYALRAFPGDETNKLLLGFAMKSDASLIANAVESLGVLKEKIGLDKVVTHLQHKDVRVRRAATGALVNIGGTLADDKRKPMLNHFSQALFDKDADVRLKAIKGLRLVKDPRTVTALAALLKDPVKSVRQATLNAMASTGSASAVEAIATGLEDDEGEVRMTAIRALGNLKQKSGAKVLLDYAKTEKDATLLGEAKKVAAGLK